MPGRRLIVAIVAGFALPLPACLHVSTTKVATPDDAPSTGKVVRPVVKDSAEAREPRSRFAELPRVPGTVVHSQPQPKATPSQDAIAAQKSANAAPSQVGPRQVVGTEPNLFPAGLLPTVGAPPEPPLLAAVRAYIEGRPERAIEIIRALPPENQNFVLAILPILQRGANADLTNDPATTAALVEQLGAVAAHLEPKAALRVEKLCLCREVEGFGRFLPRPGGESYKPSERAHLYLELRNLGSRPSDSEFITHVHAAVEVRDANRGLVEQFDPADWQRRVPVVRFDRRLVSRTPLRDFHVLYSFSTPRAPGVYTVNVELRDASTGRTVKAPPVQFSVAGP